MITFHVLGALDLRGPAGAHLASPLSGSRRLALLGYLALATPRGPQRRDTLLGLLWPESTSGSARNSLSNMVFQIRRSLGREVIVASGDNEIGLAEGALWCDAVAFEEALDDGREDEALELYRGDLLEGFFVAGASAEFDHWLDDRREGLRSRAAGAARTLADRAEQAGKATEAIRWARRTLSLDRYDERGARRLISLLDRSGDRAGALRTYESFAQLLAREFEAYPSAETRVLIEAVRARTQPGEAAAAHEQSARSVAVLPFENLSGTGEAEPFTAGLHDDLLTELSRISSLSVIARTSVLRYRGATRSAQEIGRELGVGTLVEGAVQVSQGRLRLNVQLIDARTGVHRWVERYDRELSAGSIFDLQTELAQKIAMSLRAELTPEERKRVGQEATEDLDAYRLYVQGRGHLHERTEDAMQRAVEYFRRAIEQDAGYAVAWAGLADALSIIRWYDFAPPETVPDAMQAAQRAVELAPDLGEAHASLGIAHALRQEGGVALRELRRAIELQPSHAEAYGWLGWVYLVLGRPGEALPAERRALELNPLAPAYRVFLAEAHLANGEGPEALRQARRAREIQPEYGLAHFMEGLVLHHLGRLEDAQTVLESSLALVLPRWGSPTRAEVRAALATTQVASGDRDGARRQLAEIDERADPLAAGLVHAALGESDRAFEAFERVDRWRSITTEHIRYFFPDVLGPLRRDPRYEDLLRAVDRSWGLEAGDAPLRSSGRGCDSGGTGFPGPISS